MKSSVLMRRSLFLLLFMAIFISDFVSAAALSDKEQLDRSPVDLVLAPDESWLATANQTSDSVSLVRTSDGYVLDEVKIGRRPEAITLSGGGQCLLVTSSHSGEVTILRVDGAKLTTVAIVPVGFQPHGIAAAPDGSVAYVALTAASQVAVVDLEDRCVTARIDVGRWPRHLAVSPDGSRLAVGTSGDRGLSVVDTRKQKLLYIEKFVGLNIGHIQISRDGVRAWFPWVVYRQNPITVRNIQLGWVLATRIGRVRLDGPARREAISLDPQGKAIADPHGLALSADETRLVVSASGTHELLVYRATDLPFQDYGGTDHIPAELLQDERRFARIDVGGRPMGLRIAMDNRTVYVANYLNNSVQVVDLERRQLMRSIPLGGVEPPGLARRGEAIFFDAKRSLDQWYSCHTCHYEGGTNSVAIDTWNDDTSFTFKTVLPLYNVTETAPWTWHGWQQDIQAAMKKSITSTMLGTQPSEDDVGALIAYLKSLRLPTNPFLQPDGSLTESAERGQRVFMGDQANCVSCHQGPSLTDSEIHDVGTGERRDRYQGYNPPALVGVYGKVGFLHDGRAKSLQDLLQGPHCPEQVSGTAKLSDQQLRDLIAYLQSL